MCSPITLSNLAPLKPRWNVSLQMLIRRASDLKLITQNQYRYLNQQVRSNGWTQLEPGDERIKQPKPRLMRKMAELQYGSPWIWEGSQKKQGFLHNSYLNCWEWSFRRGWGGFLTLGLRATPAVDYDVASRINTNETIQIALTSLPGHCPCALAP